MQKPIYSVSCPSIEQFTTPYVVPGLQWTDTVLGDGTYATYDINEAHRLAVFMGKEYKVVERDPRFGGFLNDGDE